MNIILEINARFAHPTQEKQQGRFALLLVIKIPTCVALTIYYRYYKIFKLLVLTQFDQIKHGLFEKYGRKPNLPAARDLQGLSPFRPLSSALGFYTFKVFRGVCVP